MDVITGSGRRIKVPKLGFLGTGWIGLNRLDAVVNSGAGEAYIAADAVSETALKVRENAGNCIIAESYEEILNSSPDGIVIATPSAMHAAQAIMALERGIPVFCQKPLGRNAAETEAVVKAAKKADRLLGVDLSYRYTDGFTKMLKIIRSGEIGNIYAAALVFHNAYGPDKEWFYNKELSGGGCVIDLGIHLIDLALYAIGFPEVKNVTSSLYSNGRLLEPGEDAVEDFASAAVKFDGGITVNLNCSWNLSAGQDAVIEATFYGTKGGVSLKNVNGSFYDFQAELYQKTKRTILSSPPDAWGGKAIIRWAEQLAESSSYNNVADDFIKSSQVLDRIYNFKNDDSN